jgi:hypothetical protein
MVTTAWATAEGIFDGDGQRRQPARAELSHDGLSVLTADGKLIAVWNPADLVRTMGPDGFRIGARRQAGAFVFDPGTGGDLIRALAVIPEAGAPATSRQLALTMVTVVAMTLAALFVLAWGFFWLIGWLFASGPGPGVAG